MATGPCEGRVQGEGWGAAAAALPGGHLQASLLGAGQCLAIQPSARHSPNPRAPSAFLPEVLVFMPESRLGADSLPGPRDQWTSSFCWGSARPLAAPWTLVPSTGCGAETLQLWGDRQGGPFALCSHHCFPQGRAPQAQGSGLDSRVGLENRG